MPDVPETKFEKNDLKKGHIFEVNYRNMVFTIWPNIMALIILWNFVHVGIDAKVMEL